MNHNYELRRSINNYELRSKFDYRGKKNLFKLLPKKSSLKKISPKKKRKEGVNKKAGQNFWEQAKQIKQMAKQNYADLKDEIPQPQSNQDFIDENTIKQKSNTIGILQVVIAIFIIAIALQLLNMLYETIYDMVDDNIKSRIRNYRSSLWNKMNTFEFWTERSIDVVIIYSILFIILVCFFIILNFLKNFNKPKYE